MQEFLGNSADWLWWGLPLLILAFGAALFLSGVITLFHRPLRGGRRIIGGGILAAIGAALGLVGVNLHTYSRLAYETPVAEVRVQSVALAEKRYQVTVHYLDGSEREVVCMLQGDEWLLSARVQTWQPWVNVLGLNATYTLDQLANKYVSAAEANGKTITACDVSAPPPDVNAYLPEEWVRWVMSMAQTGEREFGSANYMPLIDGAVYRVTMTQNGLSTTTESSAAPEPRPIAP